MDEITTVVTAFATVVLALLTGWYVRLTYHMLQEAKATKEPNVWVDLELTSYEVKLMVGNSGSSPARNLRFDIKDNVPWRKIENHEEGFNAIQPIKDGISYLAPDRVLKYEAGLIDFEKTLNNKNSTVEIILKFDSDIKKNIRREFLIDMGQYNGVLLETFRNPASEISKAIRDVRDSLKHDKSGDTILSRMLKKKCPICGEKISSDARKCPMCLEFIDEVKST